MADATDEFAGFKPAPADDEFAGFSPAPEQKSKFDPTEGMSTSDKFLAGVGKSFVDTGRGAYEIGATLGNKMGMVSDDKMKSIQSDIADSRELDKPLMDTTAGTVGNITGTATQMALAPELMPAKVAAVPLVADAISGGIVSGIQPTEEGESRATNAALGTAGGAAGSAAGKILGTLVQPLRSALDSAGKSAVDTLIKAGIPLDIAQQTGNRIARTLKNSIADNPLIGHSAFPEEQGHAFNRAVLKNMGITDPAVTVADDATMAEGRKKITDVMDAIAQRTRVKYDPELESDLDDIGKAVPGQLSPNDAGPVYHHLENILESSTQNNGDLPGLVFQKIRSQLGLASKDPKYAPLMGDIREALDDALQRSAAPGDAEKLATARSHYQTMKQIEGAIDPATGNISPGTLINKINTSNNRNQALYGKGNQNLVKLAKAAKNVLGARNPDSGTARRLAGMGAIAAVAGGGDELLRGDPSEALKVGVGAAALPYLARQLIEKPAIVKGAMMWNNSPIIKGTTDTARRVLATGTPATIEEKRESHAAGGRTGPSDDELVERLMKSYRAAKRAEDASTKSLLKMPDAAIIHALKISGSGI